MTQLRKLFLGLRAAQVLFALIALSTALTGNINICTFGALQFESESEIEFLVVNGFLVMILVPVWSYVIELKRMVSLPHPALYMVFDFIWIVLAFAGGIAAASSTVIRRICGDKGMRIASESVCDLNCGALQASIAFTFLIFCVSLVTFFFGYKRFEEGTTDGGMQDKSVAYQDGSTPRIFEAAPSTSL